MEADFNELTLSQKREHYEKLAAVGMPDAKDITEKLLMARNAVLFNKSVTSKSKNKVILMNKAADLTGANKETIKAAFKTMKENVKFYDIHNYRRQHFDRDMEFLRYIVTDLYVNKRLVPRVKDIIDGIKDSEYNKNLLLSDLAKLGYLWKRLPGTDVNVLIENPEQLYSRISYLEKIKEYRRNRRCLVYINYIDKSAISAGASRSTYSFRVFAASPSLGLLKWTSYPYNHSHLDQRFWCVLLPLLPQSCVLVVDSKEVVNCMINKIPTPSSRKSEIIKWLEAENLPHNPSWHRAELYKLVEAYKRYDRRELNSLEEFSKTSGHDFLIAPDLPTSLNYYRDIKEASMKSMQPEEWLEHDTNLAKREDKIYQDSIKFEKIIDNIFTIATYEDVRDMCQNLNRHSSKDKDLPCLASILNIDDVLY